MSKSKTYWGLDRGWKLDGGALSALLFEQVVLVLSNSSLI